MICMVDERSAPNAADRADGREQLAAFLKDRRQVEFAKEVGCSAAHLSMFLSKRRGISYRLAKRVSEASGISIDALMCEDA